MNNIYGQDENVRNSIVELPDGFAASAGNTLYAWLGSLWRGLHRGDDMVRGLQAARGIRLAQLYIDILESARLQDRNGAPVFHRELWHPIVVRKSQRDMSQENLLRIGQDGKRIGPQPYDPETDYKEGSVFKIGRMANFENHVTYPLSSDISGGALSIVDNPVNPTVVLERGPEKDYEIRGGAIIFKRDEDPLGDGSVFERYDIPDMIVGPDGTKSPDVEAVLWASDVLIDRGYVADHVSYALGANTPSSDVVKRILNAVWSATSSGLTPELVKTLMASLLNVPFIQNERENVIDVTYEYDSLGNAVSQLVRTDLAVYRVSMKARIRSEVHTGALLKRGDLLDETVRIYPFLNVPECRDGRFSVPLERDIPSVVIPPSLIRARTEYGIYAMWPETEIKRSVKSPGSDNSPHLYFDLGGTESDVLAFWSDVWSAAERSGVSMRRIVGEEGETVSPADFMLRNLIGANSLFVVIDRDQADDISLMRNPMFFDMLSDVIPASVRLFLIEHDSVGRDDRMDLGEAAELHSAAAAVPEVTEEVMEESAVLQDGRKPSFGECVKVRFVRPKPIKVRKRKEEE